MNKIFADLAPTIDRIHIDDIMPDGEGDATPIIIGVSVAVVVAVVVVSIIIAKEISGKNSKNGKKHS